jgi:hypothetical protein
MNRTIIRGALITAYIGLAVFLFMAYRGHTLLIDNHDAGNLTAPDMITVSLDRGKPVDFFRRDRDRVMVTGSVHSVRVEFSDGRTAFEGKIRLPLKDDMYLLSIPRLLNNEPCVEVFKTAPETRDESEPPPTAETFF